LDAKKETDAGERIRGGQDNGGGDNTTVHVFVKGREDRLERAVWEKPPRMR